MGYLERELSDQKCWNSCQRVGQLKQTSLVHWREDLLNLGLLHL